MIFAAQAHEGESHGNEREIETVSFGTTATAATYVVLVVIVVVGSLLLIYNYGKRK
jgi:hypothetical protein